MHISADSNSSKAIPKQYHLDASVAEGWRGRERHQEQKRVSKKRGDQPSHNSMEVFCNSDGATTTQHKVHIRVVPV